MSQEVKQAEELMAEGGKFYEMGGHPWCDLPTSSWYLDPDRGGYVRYLEHDDPPGEPEVEHQ